jgi:hypothetical protein
VVTIIKTKRAVWFAGLSAIAASAGLLEPASAQNETLTVEVGRCVDLPTPEQRLACFEAQVEAARTAPPPSPAEAGATPEEFGFRTKEEEHEREVPPDLLAKVVELREVVPNAYVITLDNGQVWRQTQPKYNYFLREGDDVRIYTSRWRSYRLTTPGQSGHVQVERVR